jgi:hypothetical protein
MTGPDAKLGDKISLAGGARKRRVGESETFGSLIHDIIRDTT